ncbi:MAG: hypothetical protein MUC92_13935 [Fimbriimonadaceae bacterium]|nr:hypothetical protein [Fimbriimonadaceae bacterium]
MRKKTLIGLFTCVLGCLLLVGCAADEGPVVQGDNKNATVGQTAEQAGLGQREGIPDRGKYPAEGQGRPSVQDGGPGSL